MVDSLQMKEGNNSHMRQGDEKERERRGQKRQPFQELKTLSFTMASTEGSNVAYIYYHKLTIEPQNPSSKKIILGYFYENLYENL